MTGDFEMTKDAFKARERALEAEFFHRVDEQLLADLKSKMSLEQEIEALQEATGFSDRNLLNELVALGLSPETIMAISLVPLVLAAWADGKVDDNERPAIFAAAKEQGITDGSPAAKMLKHWLKTKPGTKLGSTWIHYIQTIYDDLEESGRLALVADFDRRTSKIAQASGGVLGIGKISSEEKSEIAELRQAFAG